MCGAFVLKSIFIYCYQFNGLIIVSGTVLRYLSFYFTTGQDTYSATHNRIDALAWGVLLSILINYYGAVIKGAISLRICAFIMGTSIFVVATLSSLSADSCIFNKIYFHSLIPISFFLLMFSIYHVEFSNIKCFGFISYYSYNWYLWHPIVAIYITDVLGNTLIGIAVYLIATFLIAMITTILIEERFIKLRDNLKFLK